MRRDVRGASLSRSIISRNSIRAGVCNDGYGDTGMWLTDRHEYAVLSGSALRCSSSRSLYVLKARKAIRTPRLDTKRADSIGSLPNTHLNLLPPTLKRFSRLRL